MVTDTYDATDATPGDGICADAGGHLYLARGLCRKVMHLPVRYHSSCPRAIYTLSITGNAEHAAARGDLDLLDDITSAWPSADRTVVDAAGLDRAIEAINAGTVLIEKPHPRKRCGRGKFAGLRALIPAAPSPRWVTPPP